MTIRLGDKVKDTITGFSGIAVAVTDWLHGCRRITVQPEKIVEGKYPDNCTFDEPQLQIVKAAKVKEGSHLTGGPRPSPRQAPGPIRS